MNQKMAETAQNKPKTVDKFVKYTFSELMCIRKITSL